MNVLLLHRDFRIEDNIALSKLLEKSNEIALIFIKNKNIIDPNKNKYFSKKAYEYLNSAIYQLNKKVNINIFEGYSEVDVFKNIHKKESIKRIYTNKDWTDFAIKRDNELKIWCDQNGIEFKNNFNDYLLSPPGAILTNENKYYKVFTGFYNKLIKNASKISKPIEINKFKSIKINGAETPINFTNIKIPIKREDIFKNLENHKNYDVERDLLHLENGTTKVATAIKFGVVSCREVFWRLWKIYDSPESNLIIRQLIWREFFYHHKILATQSGDWNFGDNINKEYDQIDWDKSWWENNFDAWKEGRTGVPIVDAAMNELNQTGFMHNRARMIVASFLTKNLMVHWKHGERYFAQNLYDYDPIVNQQSWQWVAGPGLDSRNAYRIFSMKRQKERFDPESIYINRWLSDDYEPKKIIQYEWKIEHSKRKK